MKEQLIYNTFLRLCKECFDNEKQGHGRVTTVNFIDYPDDENIIKRLCAIGLIKVPRNHPKTFTQVWITDEGLKYLKDNNLI